MFYGLYNNPEGQSTTGTLPAPGSPAAEGHSPLGTLVLPQSSAVAAWPAMYRGGIRMLSPQGWQLALGGLVDKPKNITYDQLIRYPQVNQFRRVVAAEGWTYRSRWEGVLLKHLLNEVKPLPQARFLKQTNASGMVEYLPLDVALNSDLLLLTKESGQPLDLFHGGPVRLMVFNRYLHKGLGQIVDIEFVAEEGPGFWETLGYERMGVIQPGKYYAFDLKSFRPIERPGEVLHY